MKLRLLIILFTIHPFLLSAQEVSRKKFPFFSLSPHTGFIIPHADELREISRSTPVGFQAEAGFIHTGPVAYAQTRSFSRLGLSLQHMGFGNRRELGSSTALSAYLEPYILPDSRVQLSFRFGIGATYLSRVHHPESNPRNIFFSSPVSFVTYLAFSSRVNIHPHWKINASLFYNHISNGGAKMPNKGINYPTLSVGLDYLPFGETFIRPEVIAENPKSWLFWFEKGFSGKNTPARPGGSSEMAFILNASVLAEKKVGVIHGFSAGLEFSEDGFRKLDFEYRELELAHQLLGLLAGHTFHLGKFRLSQHYGLYLFNREPDSRIAYQRYGLYYQCGKRLYVGGTLKVHRHIADIFDVRLGWRFRT